MPDNNHTAINNSVSKQLYSFSKDDRFHIHKSLNPNISYEFKSEFHKNKENGDTRPFYHTSQRFNYYASPQKAGKLPSPFHYKLGDTFGEKSLKKNQEYTFGVGRGDMKKVFIDDIRKKGDHSLPGPGRYDYEKQFGSEGLNYSMAAKLPTEGQALDRSRKLPGPGSYKHTEVLGKPLIQSNIMTESFYSFSKANDRFNVPTRKVAAPAPNAYQPLNNLNQNYNSTFIKAQMTKIGNDKSSIIDQHFKLKVKNPGPGAYSAFSEFSGQQ